MPFLLQYLCCTRSKSDWVSGGTEWEADFKLGVLCDGVIYMVKKDKLHCK